MVKPNEVLFVTDESSKYLFKDLCNLKGIHSYIFPNPKNSLINFIKRVHINPKIGRYLWLPKRDIWYNKETIIERIPKNGYLMINSSAMVMTSLQFWQDIRCARRDVKFVLLLVDSMNVAGGHMVETRKRIKKFNWNMILSYDKYDCERYGFKFIGLNYYSKYKMKHKEIKNDLYYIATIKKGRDNYLRSIYNKCLSVNIEFCCKIYSLWRRINYGICIRSLMPYQEVLDDIQESNCILEVLQDGQKTQSIRYLEAVCYNRKLLSNNVDLSKLPYYDARYMKYFKSVDDIDWDWVRRKEKINYHYNGEFSSANILQYI